MRDELVATCLVASATATISVEEENLCARPVRFTRSNRRILTRTLLEQEVMEPLLEAKFRSSVIARIELTVGVFVVVAGRLCEKLIYWILKRTVF